MPAPPQDDRPPWFEVGFALLLSTGFATVLAYEVIDGHLAALRAALLGLMGAITIWFVLLFRGAMRNEAWPAVETHWGGLGGGLGGWRVAPAFVYLVGALAFGSLLVAVALQQPPAAGDVAAAAADPR